MNAIRQAVMIGCRCISILAGSVIISSCGPGQFLGPTLKPTFRRPLSTPEVRALAAKFVKIASGQIEAWNTHDVDTILKVYTEDIVHYSGAPKYTGIDQMRILANRVMSMSPQFEGNLGDAYIAAEDGVDVWKIWNVMTFTKDQPVLEYDLIQIRDGLISYWRLFYTPDVMPWMGGGKVNIEFLANYGSTWSSRDPKAIAAMYTKDAVRVDTLFKEQDQGRNAIEAFATGFSNEYPNTRWELLQPFGESSPGTVQGGVYAIHVSDATGKPCAVQTLVLLDLWDNAIVSERVYYNAESLIACNWAR